MKYEPLFRSHLLTLFREYNAATGCTPEQIGLLVVNDGKLYARLSDENNGFTVSTYDRFTGRMSAIWPGTTPWPDGIPRPDPITQTNTSKRGGGRPPKLRSDASAEAAPNG